MLSAMLLGIEVENAAGQYCTYEQYDSTAELIVQLSDEFHWQFPYYILGHYEVAVPLGRRSDPHGWDWGDFIGRLVYHSIQHGMLRV